MEEYVSVIANINKCVDHHTTQYKTLDKRWDPMCDWMTASSYIRDAQSCSWRVTFLQSY